MSEGVFMLGRNQENWAISRVLSDISFRLLENMPNLKVCRTHTFPPFSAPSFLGKHHLYPCTCTCLLIFFAWVGNEKNLLKWFLSCFQTLCFLMVVSSRNQCLERICGGLRQRQWCLVIITRRISSILIYSRLSSNNQRLEMVCTCILLIQMIFHGLWVERGRIMRMSRRHRNVGVRVFGRCSKNAFLEWFKDHTNNNIACFKDIIYTDYSFTKI